MASDVGPRRDVRISLTLGDALGEFLADITEAARMIGTILQQVGSDAPQHLSTPPGAKGLLLRGNDGQND
jgi:hypothetical protein